MALSRLILAFSVVLFSALPAMAQQFDYKAVLAASFQHPLVVDAGYEESTGREVPLHFTIAVPVALDLMRVQSDTSKPGHYTKLIFATLAGETVESLELRQATMGPGTPEERMGWLADMMRDEIFPSVLGSKDTNLIGVRRSTAGDYPAVELVATYENEGLGTIVFRIMGVFPPSGEHILVALSHTVIKFMPLEKTADLQGTLAGTILNSLHFTATRGADGALIAF